MRIALIASRLHTGGGKIIGEKTAENLALLCKDARLLIVRPEDAIYEFHGHPHITEVPCPRQSLLKQYWWDLRVLSRILKEFKPDWVWALGNYPVPSKFPQSVLIQDAHLTFDQSYFRNETWNVKLKKWIGFRLILSRIQLPRRFYCQTTAIRSGAVDKLGIDPEKIGLYPPGIESIVSSDNPSDSIVQSPAVQRVKDCSGKFVLFYPARCYGHKNHQVIVEAYSRYREELSDTRCFLTISPSDHQTAATLLKRIDDERLTSIVNLGPISREEVAAIFQISDALLMPTKLETFGIPFVEAMQSGTPIITSNYDFIRAVCHDAALYLDNPDDPMQLLQAILELQRDNFRRSQLAELGHRIAQSLPSWNESVRSVLLQEGISCSSQSEHR